MYIAMSRFTVANGMTEEVKNAFLNRPHLVDSVPGFVRLDVMTPADDPDEFWVITYWDDEESYNDWYKSPGFRESHKGVPKGLKIVGENVDLRSFAHVCS